MQTSRVLVRLAAIVSVLLSCEPSSQRGERASVVIAPPKPSATAVPPPSPPSPPSHARVFAAVIVARDGRVVDIHPAGERALIADGVGLWGYARAKAEPVHDPAIGNGLPREGSAHPEHVGGHWPRVAMSYGEKQLTEHGGADTVLYELRAGAFARVRDVPHEVPRGVALGKNTVYAFTPSSTYAIAGFTCSSGVVSTRPLVFSVRDGKKVAPPSLPRTYFPREFATDGSGGAWSVGADACQAGAFIASVDAARWKLERVPGSDACTERMNHDGMPFTRARLFPAAHGGLHVLLTSDAIPGSVQVTPGPCTAPSRILSRSATGEWSASRDLPTDRGEVEYVDPAGTAWAVRDRREVVRIPQQGAIDPYLPDASCSRPGEADESTIDRLVVPFADQPWIRVRANGITALCTAPLDR